jgi:hypothetical protein
MTPEFKTKVNDLLQKAELDFEENPQTELNSYRFPKPRFYNPNQFRPKEEMNTAELLCNISTLIGPKERPAIYDDFLNHTLKKSLKPKKSKAALLNSLETDPVSLKGIYISVEGHHLMALVDTGSTHNLLAYDIWLKLQNKTFTPVNMDM